MSRSPISLPGSQDTPRNQLFGIQANTSGSLSPPSVLPSYANESIVSAIPAPDVTKVALRIRRLVEECVPCELEEAQVTRSHSRIITKAVIKAAKEAGGAEHGACVVSFSAPRRLPIPF